MIFEALQAAIGSDTRLLLQVKRERDYYREKTASMTMFIRLLGLTFTLIFAIAAALGGAMTMYGTVASRAREIGMLRALGFSRRSILAVFVFEALLLGTVAGLFSIALGVALQYVTVSTMNWSTFSELAFHLTLTPAAALATMAFACIVSLLGGLPPAVQAARLSVTGALRSATR